jgi:hypothetical protein
MIETQINLTISWEKQEKKKKNDHSQEREVNSKGQKLVESWAQWLIPVILATQEVAIRRIVILDQAREEVCETPHLNQ